MSKNVSLGSADRAVYHAVGIGDAGAGLVAVDEIFVGRKVELAFLRGRLAETLGGVSRVVLIEGAAGVGKTALLGAFLGRTGHHRVMRVSGDELETDLAYALVAQLVSETGRPPPEQLARIGTGRDAGVAPEHIGAALVEMLGWLQADGPVVMVLDDAHWADVPSLQALGFALRRLRSSRVLALLSARDVSTDQLPASLRRLVATPPAARLRLRGLGVDELRTLSTALGAGVLPLRAAERLHEHTGGNPLHARALLEEFPAGVLNHGTRPLPAPRSFGTLVQAQLAGCPPDAERLVTAAAVLGTSCPLALAARLAEIPDPLKALEQAAAAQLLAVRRGTPRAGLPRAGRGRAHAVRNARRRPWPTVGDGVCRSCPGRLGSSSRPSGAGRRGLP